VLNPQPILAAALGPIAAEAPQKAKPKLREVDTWANVFRKVHNEHLNFHFVCEGETGNLQQNFRLNQTDIKNAISLILNR